MLLSEAKKILKKYGYICEDTNELDDADIPVGINVKNYRAQKSKQMSLADKIDYVTPKKTEREIAEEEFAPQWEKIIKPLIADDRYYYGGFERDNKYPYPIYSYADTNIGYRYDKKSKSIKLYVTRLYLGRKEFDIDDLESYYEEVDKFVHALVR